MDGVAAVRSLLVANADFLQLVEEDNVSAGPRPLDAALPGVMLESLSRVDRNIPAPGARRHVRERVQATVMARNYPEQKAILRALRHAAADKVNLEVEGITNVTVHTDGAGPDYRAESVSVWIGSQDFMTTYTETR